MFPKLCSNSSFGVLLRQIQWVEANGKRARLHRRVRWRWSRLHRRRARWCFQRSQLASWLRHLLRRPPLLLLQMLRLLLRRGPWSRRNKERLPSRRVRWRCARLHRRKALLLLQLLHPLAADETLLKLLRQRLLLRRRLLRVTVLAVDAALLLFLCTRSPLLFCGITLNKLEATSQLRR
jgi:hypothetical protein